ncbi:unnamed protein product [Cylindrotheca closterium]|uniref:Pentacotripeptide-repeat region of PRORP domain-containing protein n=1 Tax=Cylindrotheca closterium TaxID=2856 RepID=A0AAD2FTL8_9STRA|nr:unnamed protein product [Cylindrotheca closterium]
MMLSSRSRAIIRAIFLFLAFLEVKSLVPYKNFAVPTTFQLDALSRNGKESSRLARLRVNSDRLHRVVKSIEYYGQKEGSERRASSVLLNAMRMLLEAKTQDKISYVGNLLNKIDIVNEECRPIQERVITATSLAGLVSISTNILTNMLQSSYLPSNRAYIAACSALRQSGRLEELERLIYDLAEIGTKLDTDIDAVAWNIYLSSLCSSIGSPNDPTLARIWEWMQPSMAQRLFRVTPDVTSFNILLDGAARVRNTTLVERVWQDLKGQRGVEPDIVSYNARLKASSGASSRAECFDILEEIESRNISPDAFTIDLVSNHLIRAGRYDDLQSMVDQFLTDKSERDKSKALAAFLVTLVQQENIESARNLFDRCALDESSVSSVTPCTRHFNILLDGYSKIAQLSLSKDQLALIQKTLENPSGTFDNLDLDPTKVAALTQGRELCRKVVSFGVEQDPYTLSSMISLCISSDEIIELMNGSTASLSPAVIRCAITYLGRLGDPSQACRVFDQFAFQSYNNRVWNVLLGALSEGAKQGNSILDINSTISSKRHVLEGKGISSLVDGLTCADAAQTLLSAMNGMREGVEAPKPNSQSYCLVAASASQIESVDPSIAMSLFRNATSDGIPADGRFVNAVLRCFGGNLEQAVKFWKEEMRMACIEHESRSRTRAIPNSRRPKKNLIAAYNGLLYVCGRAIRPDTAVRVAYAMRKEGLEPNEISLNGYKAGKRQQEELDGHKDTNYNLGAWFKFLPKPNMIQQYESLLYVECTKYNPDNRRTSNDRRVRIIL